MKEIRPPAVAGMFYSKFEETLRRDIQKLFARVDDTSDLNSTVVVAPHAGYVYSGLTASHIFARLPKNKYKTVIVVAPSHHEYYEFASIFPGGAYSTPLGQILLDREKIRTMMRGSNTIRLAEQGHGREHSVEVMLPFLQEAIGEFKLVPLVMGQQNKMLINEIAVKLDSVMNDETLLVVSTDLSHFHSKKDAELIDSRIEGYISAADSEALYEGLESGACEACGGGAIVAALEALKLKQSAKPKIIHRSDSGDVSGDRSSVVGYMAASLN